MLGGMNIRRWYRRKRQKWPCLCGLQRKTVMKQYMIYQRGDSIQAVKQGWSWPAMFGLGIWSLIKGLWAVSAGMVFVTIHIYVNLIDEFLIRETPDREIVAGILLVILPIYTVICGAMGNHWLERDMMSRGYHRQGMQIAMSSAGAVMAYLYPQQQQAGQPIMQATEHPVEYTVYPTEQPKVISRQNPTALPHKRK